MMLAEQARTLATEVRCIALDPAPDAPAFAACDDHIVGRFDDPAAVEELCRRSDVVTYEFENVPGEILVPLCERYNIPQGYKPLYDSQDRLRRTECPRPRLPTPEFRAVDDETSLRRAVAELGFPAVLKTRTLGYDGSRASGSAYGIRCGKGTASVGSAVYFGGFRVVRLRGQRRVGCR